MNWILIALSGYFLNAIVLTVDKYLLHSRIAKPSVYAFYVSMFSLFAVLTVPLAYLLVRINLIDYQYVGSLSFDPMKISLSLLSGFLFVYGLVFLYKAVQENEISRVSPLVGVILPVFSIFYAAVAVGEKLGAMGVAALAVLVAGGFLISFDLPLRKRKIFKGFRYVLIAGILQALSTVILKLVFSDEQFIDGFIWNRIGFFIAGISLLIVPTFRQQIIGSFSGSHRKKHNLASTGIIFVSNKLMAGIASFLLTEAIFLGPVSLVHALGSTQFLFVLLLASLLSVRHHHIYGEKMSAGDWAQKILAIGIIAVGLWMMFGLGGHTY